MRSAEGVAKPIVKARTRKRLAPSKISGPLVFFGRFVLPGYLRFALKFRGVEIMRPEAVVSALCDFQEKRTRLIVAFRHPYGDEPQLLFHVFEKLIPRHARRDAHAALTPSRPAAGARLRGGAVGRRVDPLHPSARGRGAGVPQQVRFRDSVNAIRSIMNDGPSPLMLAPEGQISYHAETLPSIEQGTVRMGFWCARDLEKASRAGAGRWYCRCRCITGIDPGDLKKIRAALARVEALCGLEPKETGREAQKPESLLPRIERIEMRLLEMTEAYYAAAYGYRIPAPPRPARATRPRGTAAGWRFCRLRLRSRSKSSGIEARKRRPVQRMYRVRQDRVGPHLSGEPRGTALPAGSRLGRPASGRGVVRDAAHGAGRSDELPRSRLSRPRTAAWLPYDRLVETVGDGRRPGAPADGRQYRKPPQPIRKNAVLVPGRPDRPDGPAFPHTAKMPNRPCKRSRTSLPDDF